MRLLVIAVLAVFLFSCSNGGDNDSDKTANMDPPGMDNTGQDNTQDDMVKSPLVTELLARAETEINSINGQEFGAFIDTRIDQSQGSIDVTTEYISNGISLCDTANPSEVGANHYGCANHVTAGYSLEGDNLIITIDIPRMEIYMDVLVTQTYSLGSGNVTINRSGLIRFISDNISATISKGVVLSEDGGYSFDGSEPMLALDLDNLTLDETFIQSDEEDNGESLLNDIVAQLELDATAFDEFYLTLDELLPGLLLSNAAEAILSDFSTFYLPSE